MKIFFLCKINLSNLKTVAAIVHIIRVRAQYYLILNYTKKINEAVTVK